MPSPSTSAQLEHEVYKYSEKDPNWGKVARRLYNIFRLTGKYPEAVYIRALFDAPTTVLYQVAALLRTIQDAATEGTPFARDLLVGQCDQLIMSAIGVLTGPSEAVFVSHLLKLRDQVAGQHEGDEGQNIIPAREVTMQAVNDYFRERLWPCRRSPSTSRSSARLPLPEALRRGARTGGDVTAV